MTGHLLEAIKSIREGILSNDMSKVAEGFRLLTGESVEISDNVGVTDDAPPPEVAAEVRGEGCQTGEDLAGCERLPATNRAVRSGVEIAQ